jgi:hypothetical protein
LIPWIITTLCGLQGEKDMGELTHRMRRIHLEGNKNRRGESKEKSFRLSAGRNQHKGYCRRYGEKSASGYGSAGKIGLTEPDPNYFIKTRSIFSICLCFIDIKKIIEYALLVLHNILFDGYKKCLGKARKQCKVKKPSHATVPLNGYH